MIKPEQIKFLSEHPVQKSLFSKNSETDKTVSSVHLAIVSDTFLLDAGSAGVLVCMSDGNLYIIEEITPYSDLFITLGKNPDMFAYISNKINNTDEIIRKKGKYLVLNSLWCGTFWHWMMEKVIKAIIAMEAGFDGYYIIDDKRFMREALELLGIAEDKIIPYDKKPWLLETLYIPQPINGQSELKKYPMLIQSLRDKFLQAVGNNGIASERIYITRYPRTLRKVVNEPELMKVLEKYQFKGIMMDGLPLKEQIRIASAATCIVAPHGGGMVHTMFMPPESLILELFSPTYINPCMLPVIEHLNHRYYMIPSAKNRDYIYGDDIEANIPVIEVTLKRELKT